MSLLDKQEVQDICEHTALKNGVDLYVNERQKIRHYRARSTEERRRKKENAIVVVFFYFVWCVRKLRYYSVVVYIYTHSIGNQP